MLSLEYIAGIVDGEGSIGLIHRPSRKTISPYLRITVCHRQVLEQIREVLGRGTLYTENRETRGGLICFALVIESREDLLQVLPLLIPNLIIKKTLAEIVLQFCLERMSHKATTEREIGLYHQQLVLQQKHNHGTVELAAELKSKAV